MKVETENAIVDTGFSFQLRLNSEISWLKVGKFGDFLDFLEFFRISMISQDFLGFLMVFENLKVGEGRDRHENH